MVMVSFSSCRKSQGPKVCRSLTMRRGDSIVAVAVGVAAAHVYTQWLLGLLLPTFTQWLLGLLLPTFTQAYLYTFLGLFIHILRLIYTHSQARFGTLTLICRLALVHACKWVDEVVFDTPYNPTVELLDRLNCDFVVCKALAWPLLLPVAHNQSLLSGAWRRHRPHIR